MIQSMTGYSRVIRHTPHGTVTVEARSTNHRFLEIDHQFPDGVAGIEGELVQHAKKSFQRGRIHVNVLVQFPQGSSGRAVMLDDALAHAYYERLLELKARFGLTGTVTLDQLLALPSIFRITDDPTRRQALWSPIRQVIQQALRQLLLSRRREGKRLVKDIQTNLQLIAGHLRTIRSHLPKGLTQQAIRLRERLKGLLGETPRITSVQLQEALALVKEVDIHEEFVRLESHLAHIRQLLNRQSAMGKALDFIAQELMREANTMGAKANDVTIARYVVEIKGAIEKIREQAQNLE